MLNDVVDARLVRFDAQFGLLGGLALEVRDGLAHAARALALELPAARELYATPPAGVLGALALVGGRIDPGDRELLALCDGALCDERKRGRAGGERRARCGVAGVTKLIEGLMIGLRRGGSGSIHRTKRSKVQNRAVWQYRGAYESAPDLQAARLTQARSIISIPAVP